MNDDYLSIVETSCSALEAIRRCSLDWKPPAVVKRSIGIDERMTGDKDCDSAAHISTDLQAMEKLWAKELYELSVEDRETINDELHGASVSPMDPHQEDGWSEQDYSLYLNEFQAEVDKVPLADKQAYLEGLELGSTYITKSELRLGFLRAERYNVEKAALRYCKCLDFLVDLFGKDSLLRPLLLSDLTRKEIKFLREGYVQILPSRDRLGRRILAQLGSYGGSAYSEAEKFRVSVYLCFSVLAEDVTTQRLGVVSIASFTRGAEEFMRKETLTIRNIMKRFFAVVPVRWSAAHLCIPDDPMFHLLKSLCLFIIGLNGRRRLRIHAGSPMECDYMLRSFGIPTDDIPRTHTHSLKLRNHGRFLKVRKTVDAYVQTAMATNDPETFRFPGIDCPEINCVLFGKYAWDHPGNIEFRGLIREISIAQQERNLDLPDKMYSMIKGVVDESLSRNYHFLMYDRETYLYREVTDYGEIWGLVDQSVREYRKRSKAKRMIVETKLEIGDVSNIGTGSLIGLQANNRGKFMKDCNGCRAFVSE